LEPLKSALFSAALALQTALLTLVGAAAAEGHVSSPADLWAYLVGHWWAALLGIVLPAAYRARQKSIAVANTIQLAGGASAVITPSKGQ
jgi:hypothetical protein